MANVFINLPVPAADGVGAWTDVSTQGPERTISVDGGAFGGDILLEGSNDGQVSAAPAIVGPFPGPTFVPQTFVQAFNFLRVRRRNSGGVGLPTVNIGGPASISNVFGAMNVPAGDGVGASINISGGGDVNTFQVVGPFTDQILIETSTDGVNFSPTLIFDNGGAVGQQVLGVLSAARVRRRVNGSLAGVTPAVSVGSQATSGAAGGGFPGYGGAPPAIAAASAAGAAATVSRSDHTHAGVTSVNGAQGVVVVTAFPGFGGAPPAVAAAGSAGAAGTASRSDHTHAGVSTFQGSTGAASITSTGGSVTVTNVAGVVNLEVAGGGGFPGFGAAPPAVASASAAGAAATASRSDHTHALDVVAYNPSVAGMQAAGVIQQTFAGPTATPSLLTMVPGQIPFGGGGAATGVLAQSANLAYNGATGILAVPQLTLNNSSGGGPNASLRLTQAATQGIIKTGGVLNVGTGDANALVLLTNNNVANAINMDTGGNLFPATTLNQTLGLAANHWTNVFANQLTGANTTLTLNGAGGSTWNNTAGSCAILATTIAVGNSGAAGDTTLAPAGGGAGNAVTISGTVAQFLKIAIPINLSAGNVTPNNVTVVALGAFGPTGVSGTPVEWATLSTPGGNRAFPLYSMP